MLSVRNLEEALGVFRATPAEFQLRATEKKEIERLFFGLERGLQLEKHIYLGKRFQRNGWKDLYPLDETKNGSLISIERLNGSWQVIYRAIDGHRGQVSSKNLVFASGAIFNAVLAHLTTGITRFGFGNHVSSFVGTLKSRDTAILRDVAQHANFGRSSFLTFGNPDLDNGQGDWAFRLSGQSGIRDRLGTVLRGRGQPSLLLTSSFRLNLMLEQTLSSGSYLDVKSELVGRGLEVWIDVSSRFGSKEFDSEIQAIEALSNIDNVELEPLLNKSTGNYGWNDAAHYFGTLPFASKLEGQGIDDFYGIIGSEGVFAIGSSAFPAGGHGHPTVTALMTSVDFVSKVRTKN